MTKANGVVFLDVWLLCLSGCCLGMGTWLPSALFNSSNWGVVSACVRTSWGWQGRQSSSEFPRLLGALEKLAISSWPPAGALAGIHLFLFISLTTRCDQMRRFWKRQQWTVLLFLHHL